MDTNSIVTLIENTATAFGIAVLAIIATTIAIGVAYLLFTVGWNRLINDKSLMIGGFYLRNVPYKGYNRFRSKSWNMKKMMNN